METKTRRMLKISFAQDFYGWTDPGHYDEEEARAWLSKRLDAEVVDGHFPITNQIDVYEAIGLDIDDEELDRILDQEVPWPEFTWYDGD